MSLPAIDGEPFVPLFLDRSKAHPHCRVRRDDLYVTLPAEAGLAADECGLLKKCLYGLRDANQSFGFTVNESFEAEEYEQGTFCPGVC
eukprot:6923827-Karenia_brevis.AAC.1